MSVTVRFNKSVAQDAEDGKFDSQELRPVAEIFAKYGAKPVSVYGPNADHNGVFVIQGLLPDVEAEIIDKLSEQKAAVRDAYVPGKRRLI